MRLDINISAGLPSSGDDGFQGAQLGSQMGHLLARMEFDYPTQMIAVVKVDNGDGTYDCHRPGTDIYMSRVETISPLLVQQIAVGMTVLIRFFRRNRDKPYIVRVAGGIKPEELGTYMWAHSRGGWRNNFVAGIPGTMPDIDATPTQLDTLTSAGDILGLLLYTIGETPVLAASGDPGLKSGSPGYAQSWFWAAAPLAVVAALTDYIWWDYFTGLNNRRTPTGFVFCEELGLLIHASGTEGKIRVFDALTGSGAATPVTDGSAVSATTTLTPSTWTLSELGLTVALETLVKTFHRHTYSHNFGTSSTTDTPAGGVDEKKIVALELPGLASSWSWDVNKIWNGSTIPFRYEVISCSVNTGSSHTGFTFPGGDFLYGHPALYLPGDTAADGLIVFPVTGRKVLSTETYAWDLGDFINVRTRSVEGQWAEMTPGAQAPRYLFGNLVSYLTAGNTVNSYPWSGTVNSKLIANHIVALKAVPATSDGEIAWKYTFPELDAADHYEIDTASFSRVASSPFLAAWAADIIALGVIAGKTYTPTATASADVVHPDQAYVESVDPTGYFGSVHGILADTAYQDYVHWPTGATYYWDPVTRTGTGENAVIDQQVCQNSLVGDEDGNIYGVWLQPKIFVTCADIWHRPDASLTDRTHASPQANYSTRHNGYEADRLTPIGNKVDVWATVDELIISGGGGDKEYHATFYGMPNKVAMFRSFLGKWDRDGNRLWSQELTTYHSDTIDSSGLSLPYPGCTIRICPTSAGVFVLRLVRLSIETSLREPALLPQSTYRTDGGKGVGTDFVLHTRNTKAVLELRNASTGAVTWSQTIYDPSALAPVWCCGASMFASESASSGRPWVMGRVDFSTNYTSKVLWMDDPPTYAGLTRVSKIFTCDHQGNIEIRDAGANSIDSQGMWPYDWIAALSHTNGRSRCNPAVLDAGTLQYPVGPTDFKLWSH